MRLMCLLVAGSGSSSYDGSGLSLLKWLCLMLVLCGFVLLLEASSLYCTIAPILATSAYFLNLLLCTHVGHKYSQDGSTHDRSTQGLAGLAMPELQCSKSTSIITPLISFRDTTFSFLDICQISAYRLDLMQHSDKISDIILGPAVALTFGRRR